MTACRTCGADPCVNFDFCRACRDADRRRARGEPFRHYRPLVEVESERAAFLRRLMNPDVSLDRAWNEICRAARERYNEAPEHTYKAAQYELRTYGLPQLKKPNCQRRLNDLSTAQIKELIASVRRYRSQYPAVTDELLVTLGAIYDGRVMANG